MFPKGGGVFLEAHFLYLLLGIKKVSHCSNTLQLSLSIPIVHFIHITNLDLAIQQCWQSKAVFPNLGSTPLRWGRGQLYSYYTFSKTWLLWVEVHQNLWCIEVGHDPEQGWEILVLRWTAGIPWMTCLKKLNTFTLHQKQRTQTEGDIIHTLRREIICYNIFQM